MSKIEIEGFLYTNNHKTPITAISYAGKTLSQNQLKQLTKAQIESALFEPSKDPSNLPEFGSEDLIEFQVVFFNAPDPKSINKLGAKIKKFNRRKI